MIDENLARLRAHRNNAGYSQRSSPTLNATISSVG